MTSSNGHIFCITGPLCGEFTGEFPTQRPVMWGFFVWRIHWSLVNSPQKGQWCRDLMFSLICAWTNGWARNRCQWFEMPSCSLWCHCNETINLYLHINVPLPLWHAKTHLKDSIKHYRNYNQKYHHNIMPDPGPGLNIKTVLSTYGDFHVKDKTAVRTSYL